MQRPLSLNGYSWVEGNVVNATDPSGLQTIDPNPITDDTFPGGSLCREYRDRADWEGYADCMAGHAQLICPPGWTHTGGIQRMCWPHSRDNNGDLVPFLPDHFMQSGDPYDAWYAWQIYWSDRSISITEMESNAIHSDLSLENLLKGSMIALGISSLVPLGAIGLVAFDQAALAATALSTVVKWRVISFGVGFVGNAVEQIALGMNDECQSFLTSAGNVDLYQAIKTGAYTAGTRELWAKWGWAAVVSGTMQATGHVGGTVLQNEFHEGESSFENIGFSSIISNVFYGSLFAVPNMRIAELKPLGGIQNIIMRDGGQNARRALYTLSGIGVNGLQLFFDGTHSSETGAASVGLGSEMNILGDFANPIIAAFATGTASTVMNLITEEIVSQDTGS